MKKVLTPCCQILTWQTDAYSDGFQNIYDNVRYGFNTGHAAVSLYVNTEQHKEALNRLQCLGIPTSIGPNLSNVYVSIWPSDENNRITFLSYADDTMSCLTNKYTKKLSTTYSPGLRRLKGAGRTYYIEPFKPKQFENIIQSVSQEKTLTLLHQFIQLKKEYQIEGDPYGILKDFYKICDNMIHQDEISPELFPQYSQHVKQLMAALDNKNNDRFINQYLSLLELIGSSYIFFSFSWELPFVKPYVYELINLNGELSYLNDLLCDSAELSKQRSGFINLICRRDDPKNDDTQYEIKECYQRIHSILSKLGVSLTEQEVSKEPIGEIRKRIMRHLASKALNNIDKTPMDNAKYQDVSSTCNKLHTKLQFSHYLHLIKGQVKQGVCFDQCDIEKIGLQINEYQVITIRKHCVYSIINESIHSKPYVRDFMLNREMTIGSLVTQIIKDQVNFNELFVEDYIESIHGDSVMIAFVSDIIECAKYQIKYKAVSHKNANTKNKTKYEENQLEFLEVLKGNISQKLGIQESYHYKEDDVVTLKTSNDHNGFLNETSMINYASQLALSRINSKIISYNQGIITQLMFDQHITESYKKETIRRSQKNMFRKFQDYLIIKSLYFNFQSFDEITQIHQMSPVITRRRLRSMEDLKLFIDGFEKKMNKTNLDGQFSHTIPKFCIMSAETMKCIRECILCTTQQLDDFIKSIDTETFDLDCTLTSCFKCIHKHKDNEVFNEVVNLHSVNTYTKRLLKTITDSSTPNDLNIQLLIGHIIVLLEGYQGHSVDEVDDIIMTLKSSLNDNKTNYYEMINARYERFKNSNLDDILIQIGKSDSHLKILAKQTLDQIAIYLWKTIDHKEDQKNSFHLHSNNCSTNALNMLKAGLGHSVERSLNEGLNLRGIQTPQHINNIARQIDEKTKEVMDGDDLEQAISIIQYIELLWRILLDFVSALIPRSKTQYRPE